MIFTLYSCQDKETKNNNPNKEIQVSKEENSKDNSKGSKKEEKFLDLTKMNSNAIYAEVSNMMIEPKDFVGKRIKIKGFFGVGKVEKKNKMYFYCVIPDAMACCQQGLEFVWKGNHKYPEDYPKEGSDIEVEGYFETYKEKGQKLGSYCRLKNANLKVIKSK